MTKPPRPPLTGHLPPGLAPRGLTKLAAAEYVGCATLRAFDEQIRRGLLPGPMPGTHRYDRLALDDAMDRLSGRVRPAGAGLSPVAEADALLAEWEAQQAVRHEVQRARTERQLRGSLNPAHCGKVIGR